MPHVIVKMYAGKSDQVKARIATEVTEAIMRTAGCGEDSVSVSIEDVAPRDWAEVVYRPDIANKPKGLFKKPGYNPL